MDKDIVGLFIVLGTAVVLPISIVYLSLKSKIASEKNRKDIILAALEKDASIDIEELVKKMNKPEKLLKEKLLNKLLVGSLFCAFGVVIYITLAVDLSIKGFRHGNFVGFSCIAVPSIAIGLAFLLNYFVGRKLLAREMAAEEKAKEENA